MQIVRLFIFLTCTLLFAFHANAASWTSIGSRKGANIEIDLSSMEKQPDGKKYRVWYRERYAKPIIPESGAFSFSFLTVFAEFQCDPKQAQILQQRYAKANRSELKVEIPEEQIAKPFIPDSVHELVGNYLCKIAANKQELEQKAKEAAEKEKAAEKDSEKNTDNKATNTKKTAKAKKTVETPPPPPPEWGYGKENGAAKWGEMSPAYATCATGKIQSPIDIRKTIQADLAPVQFTYKPTTFSIINDGHTVKVELADAGGIIIDNEYYGLEHIVFHHPSEEKINGKGFAMSAHLAHKSSTGKLAMVAILISTGKEHPLIRAIWSKLPLIEQSKETIVDQKIDLVDLIPEKRGYYTYVGSLTTPPCTEGVLWTVFKTPITLSKEQISAFSTLYPNNARPVQTINERAIKETR